MDAEGRQAGLRPAPVVVPAAGRQRQQQKLVSCGRAGWVRLQGTLQVPLRGPAQPLAAVRSGACEAVLRKQSALTHVARSPLARVRCPAHTARPGLGVLPNPPEACLGPMALTPLQPDPPRLREVPATCLAGVLRCCWWVSTLVDTLFPRVRRGSVPRAECVPRTGRLWLLLT
ncbi:hypothetical protein D7Y36_03875 [Stenotrophomonas maltophilia]|nr:hypothetical protein [Stenotrophomonas maltophilia]